MRISEEPMTDSAHSPEAVVRTMSVNDKASDAIDQVEDDSEDGVEFTGIDSVDPRVLRRSEKGTKIRKVASSSRKSGSSHQVDRLTQSVSSPRCVSKIE